MNEKFPQAGGKVKQAMNRASQAKVDGLRKTMLIVSGHQPVKCSTSVG